MVGLVALTSCFAVAGCGTDDDGGEELGGSGGSGTAGKAGSAGKGGATGTAGSGTGGTAGKAGGTAGAGGEEEPEGGSGNTAGESSTAGSGGSTAGAGGSTAGSGGKGGSGGTAGTTAGSGGTAGTTAGSGGTGGSTAGSGGTGGSIAGSGGTGGATAGSGGTGGAAAGAGGSGGACTASYTTTVSGATATVLYNFDSGTTVPSGWSAGPGYGTTDLMNTATPPTTTATLAYSSTEKHFCAGALQATLPFTSYTKLSNGVTNESGVLQYTAPGVLDWTGKTKLHAWTRIDTASGVNHVAYVQFFVNTADGAHYISGLPTGTWYDGSWQEIVVDLNTSGFVKTNVKVYGFQVNLKATAPSGLPTPPTTLISVDDVWLE